MAFTLGASAQTYPFWDPSQPGGTIDGPLISGGNALFALRGDKISRWTACGGWEDLPGLTVNTSYATSGSLHNPAMMTVHDHYLYAVGFFYLDGYTGPVDNSDLASEQQAGYGDAIQIVKFDLNTGVWTPLGQHFSAHNVLCPTTIAVDDNNNIYVGFYIGAWEADGSAGTLAGQLVDMLDVSTNNGASWQPLGGGLVCVNDPHLAPVGTIWPAITALHADGANLYVGGMFQGTSTLNSHEVIMWTGTSWRTLAGVLPYDTYCDVGGDVDQPYGYSFGSGLSTVNAITSIGTNIYVAGSFRHPGHSLARFSNVTGQALPVGDPATYLGWPVDTSNNGCIVAGAALAVNNGQLYLGGFPRFGASSPMTFLGCLTDPQGANAAGWVSLPGNVGVGYATANWCKYLAADPAGNAVYAYGSDQAGNFNNGLSRWVLGPDEASPTASIDVLASSITKNAQNTTIVNLAITGTPGSHWWVKKSLNPAKGGWENVGTNITLWSADQKILSFSDNNPGFYKLVNNCGESNFIAPPGATPPIAYITGTSVWGYQGCTLSILGTPGSTWSVLSATSWNGDWQPVGDVTLSFDTTAVTFANGHAYYRLLSQDGTQLTDPVAALLVNVQFGRAGFNSGPYVMTGWGAGGIGVDELDQWNFVSLDNKEGGSFALSSVPDYRGVPTMVSISGASEDLVVGSTSGNHWPNLCNGYITTGGGEDLPLELYLPPGTYNIYMYNDMAYSPTTFSWSYDGASWMSPTVSPDGYTPYAVLSEVSANGGPLYLNASSGVQPVCNGLQILWVGPYR